MGGGDTPVSKRPRYLSDFDYDNVAPEDDIFSEAVHSAIARTSVPTPKAVAAEQVFDDNEGYLNIRVGDNLSDGKYKVMSILGKGMYSSVVKALDTSSGNMVAVKILRNNPVMYRAGLKEHEILAKLEEERKDPKWYIVHYLGKLEIHGHLCLIFENLSMNLRELLKKFGKDVGLSIQAVQLYTRQIFSALAVLKKCRVVHADIKPDNILVTESKNTIRLCDFGTGCFEPQAEASPYLVSRFYRAPEVILGYPFGCEIDVWSAACTIYELYAGRVLFPGRSNNHMLKLAMDLKGKFPPSMLRHSVLGSKYFNLDGNYEFFFDELDIISGKSLKRSLVYNSPTLSLQSLLAEQSASAKEKHITSLLVDLLDKCLSLSPDKRITPKVALMHPFLRFDITVG